MAKRRRRKIGTPSWKLAQEFFEKIEDENEVVYYSGYILKELSFALEQIEFNKKLQMFNYSPNFLRTKLSTEEYQLARAIEKETNYEISFYDVIHILLARKTSSILITRDNKLIEIAKKYLVIVKKPEEIL